MSMTPPPPPGRSTPPEFIPSTIEQPQPRKRDKATGLVAIAGALLGLGAGIAITAATMEPETIVETKRVEVEVEVPAELPAVCGGAYKVAEEALLQYEDLAPLFTKAMEDVNRRDMPALEAHTSQIKTLQDDIFTGLKGYYLAKYTCEEALGTTLPEAVTGPTAPGLSTPSI